MTRKRDEGQRPGETAREWLNRLDRLPYQQLLARSDEYERARLASLRESRMARRIEE